MSYKEIIYNKEGNLGIITINRPERMNALTYLALQEMTDALEDAARDPQVRALIFTGTGDRAFSAGHDFSHLQGIASGEEKLAASQQESEESIFSFFPRLYELEKPTLAAINGVVAVGSFGVILACDIRIASDKARFAPRFLKRSLLPHNGVSWFLPRLLGESRALELLYSDDILDAEQALKLGLVSHVVPHDKLMEFTKEYATRIGNGPPLAMALTKRLIHQAFSSPSPRQQNEEKYQQQCHETEDFKEAVAAFQEKREPIFRGK